MVKMTPIAQVVRIGLIVGAAKADATREQLKALQTTVIPACSDEHWLKYGDEEPILSAIREIMGPNWKPCEVWAQRIAAVSPDR